MKIMSRYALTALLIVGLVGALGCKPNETTAPQKVEVAPEKTAEPTTDKAAEPVVAQADAAQDAPKVVAAEGGSTEDDGEGGRWVKSDLYGVKFRVPDDWEVVIDAEGISATDSDKTTTVILVGSESTGMIQAALNDIKKKVAFKDAKLDKTDVVVIGGFPGQTVRGSAVLEKGNAEANADQEIQFIAHNVSVGKKSVTMMIFSEAEMYEAKKELIENIGQTIAKN